MTGPRNTEPQANGALARALKVLNPEWNDETLHAERTHVIYEAASQGELESGVGKSPGGTGKQPDILVATPRRQPVVVETEFEPAHTVDLDAINRLGARLMSTGEEIEGALSVILPKSLKHGDLDCIENSTFQYATHYLNRRGEPARWPTNDNWLEGGIDELADAIEYLSLSERKLAAGTDLLEEVVRNAAGLLHHYAGETALARLAEKLYQEAGTQTERMVAAIFVSAFVFHVAIEEQEDIPAVPLTGSISKSNLVDTWDQILRVNYWPVFSIARDLLIELPVRAIPQVMDRIASSISNLANLGVTNYHDLTGRMFQTLISDRKFLATYYTLPESACLLAELAVDRLDIKWSDKQAIENLRIADFACGTGTLLSAVQRAIYRRYRRHGGDDKDLHQIMLERVLIGLDIMPAATHLTCSMLSSCHPSLAYGESQIHTMPYGIEGNLIHIGSLDLLESQDSLSLFATGEELSGTGPAALDRQHSVTVNNKSCDLVIMNPPFTRPTNHERTDVPVPSFAGFGTTDDEQKAMSAVLKKSNSEFGHGNAGLASNFMDLGHRKLKDGGVLALVVPFTFLQGKGWEKARLALDSNYSDIQVLSIATTGSKSCAFSADTGMAECLVLATKRCESAKTVHFSNFQARPHHLLEASVEAKNSRNNAFLGSIFDAGCAGVRSSNVIEAAQRLKDGKLSLPRQTQKLPISIVKLGTLANRGLLGRDISGVPPRAAFKVRRISGNEIPEYPSLWNHEANRERMLVVKPDSCGEVHPEYHEKAARDWERTASRLHHNVDFRINSQSLAMCITSEKCLGGRAWPNIIPHNELHEIPLLLWCNSTLGLLLRWWKGTRQQQGRSSLSITAVPESYVLNTNSLSEQQIKRSYEIFDEFKTKVFLPANEAYRDTTRQELDRTVLCDILGLPPEILESLTVLRNQWCAEPSVHGGKSTRIEID